MSTMPRKSRPVLPVDREAVLAACRTIGYEEIASWAAKELGVSAADALNTLYELGEE